MIAKFRNLCYNEVESNPRKDETKKYTFLSDCGSEKSGQSALPGFFHFFCPELDKIPRFLYNGCTGEARKS